MKIYKFGGASTNSRERICSILPFIKEAAAGGLVLVFSAMGKTTNALEKVVKTFFNKERTESLALFNEVKQSHLKIADELELDSDPVLAERLQDIFTEAEWLLHDEPVQPFDYYYDQIVCTGELMGSAIMDSFLRKNGIDAVWIDARDIIRTDDNYRDAAIDWEVTRDKTKSILERPLNANKIVLTQGFIGSTDENESTTLGREGSDFSASIIAKILAAESVTIWKDVPGVMCADPKQFPDAEVIAHLNFAEVVEMAFYGAQIIHPKTVKPLQNAGIPLLVKSFVEPGLPGTIIDTRPARNMPPVIVLKKEQCLIQFISNDFSFVEGETLAALRSIFEKNRLLPNLSQHTAIALLCCFDNKPGKIENICAAAAEFFDVNMTPGLHLLTLRHYDTSTEQKFLKGKDILLQQRTKETLQTLYRIN